MPVEKRYPFGRRALPSGTRFVSRARSRLLRPRRTGSRLGGGAGATGYRRSALLDLLRKVLGPDLARYGLCDKARAFHTRSGRIWRSGPESNRHPRICSPMHHHSATGPPSAGAVYGSPRPLGSRVDFATSRATTVSGERPNRIGSAITKSCPTGVSMVKVTPDDGSRRGLVQTKAGLVSNRPLLYAIG